MTHKFDPNKGKKLVSKEREKILPVEQVLDVLEVKTGQVWADLGCGIGYLTLPLAKAVGEQGKVFGLDISSEMLQMAEVRQAETGSMELPVEFRQMLEYECPLSDHLCDGVIVINVLHEIEDKQKILAEIKRILKPNGKIVIVEWEKKDMKIGPPTDHRLGEQELIAILDEASFKQLKSQPVGIGHMIYLGIMA